jgi:hypothetical protein
MTKNHESVSTAGEMDTSRETALLLPNARPAKSKCFHDRANHVSDRWFNFMVHVSQDKKAHDKKCKPIVENKTQDKKCNPITDAKAQDKKSTKVKGNTALVAGQFKSSWILDSGASTHFCNNRAKFVTISPCSPHEITTAGNIVTCTKIGTAGLRSRNGATINLTNCYYAPKFPASLLSYSAIN